MRKKLVLIGAGSVIFIQALVSDLIRDSKRKEWHLALVDIDEKVLETSRKLCEKMIKFRNANIELSYSTDRCDVLSKASYVVSTIGVGGRRAWERDVFIPRKYGIFQPVGDSVMPGGISRAMRMIPAMLDITKDVMRLCPDVCFFNYSNPMTYICRAVRKATGFPMTGLCHGVNNVEDYLARFAGLERDKVTSFAVGLNHLTFFYDFRYEGRDAWPVVKEKLAEFRRKNPDNSNVGAGFPEMGGDFGMLQPFSWELFNVYNAFPAAGDRHVVEFYPERFSRGGYYGKTPGVDVYSFEDTIEHGDRAYGEMERLADLQEHLAEEYFGKTGGEHEQLIDIIHSMEHDERKVFSVNLPNNGAVLNLPADAVLELPAAATARGLLPLQIRDFPDTLAGIIMKHLSIAEIAVEAALKGDRNLFVEAVMMGGYISERSTAAKMVDEMIAVHKQYLPQFE